MSLYTLSGQLPRHRYVLVDSVFTHTTPCGFVPAVWFGLVSNAGRAWGCTVMLESGAVYRALPPHAIAFTEYPTPNWTIQDAQTWDCYGTGFSTIEYEKFKRVVDYMAETVYTEQKLIEGRRDFYNWFNELDDRRENDMLSVFPEMMGFYRLCQEVNMTNPL